MAKNLKILHYKSGGSNKVYIVRIDETLDGKYKVVGAYGSALADHFKEDVKYIGTSIARAEDKMHDVVMGKASKGYVDIESSFYKHKLTPRDIKAKMDLSLLYGKQDQKKRQQFISRRNKNNVFIPKPKRKIG